MTESRNKGQPHMTREARAYDAASETWVKLNHDTPAALLEAKEGPCRCAICVAILGDEPVASDISAEREVWKTLVRYVWHNARSVSEACVFFGRAAIEVNETFLTRMRPDEVEAIRSGGAVNGSRTAKVFQFRERMVYRVWQPLKGYTSLQELLGGVQGECTDGEDRRDKLRALFRASWQDLRTRKFETSLRAAFANFAAITGEDRELVAFITQTEFARAFDETRAAMCARQKRKVKYIFVANGLRPPRAPGGKGEDAIAKYSEAQKGNHNRAGDGERRIGLDIEERRELDADVDSLRDHAGVPMRSDLPKTVRARRKWLDQLAEDSERRRLATLCGIAADTIDLDKTKPKP